MAQVTIARSALEVLEFNSSTNDEVLDFVNRYGIGSYEFYTSANDSEVEPRHPDRPLYLRSEDWSVFGIAPGDYLVYDPDSSGVKIVSGRSGVAKKYGISEEFLRELFKK